MINFTLKHENAQEPVRGSEMAAGWDLHAAEILRDTPHEFWVDTGVAFEIPYGMFGDLRARSSVSEAGLILANGAGVLDADYRGTIQFRFYKIGRTVQTDYEVSGVQFRGTYPAEPKTYDVGDRVGQIIFQSYYNGELNRQDELSETTRGTGGFGSTGN